MELDTRTLIVACAMVSMLFGCIALLYAAWQPKARAVRIWGACVLLMAVGNAGVALRGMIPDILSIAVANSLIVAATAGALSAMHAFRGLHKVDPLTWIVSGGVFLLIFFLLMPPATLAMRIALVSAVLTVLLARCAIELRRHAHPECTPSYRFTEAVFWLAAVTMVVRGVTGATQPATMDFMAPNSVHAAPYLVFTGVIAASTMGVFWIEVQHLQSDLRHMASHDALTGLLNRQAFLEAAEREQSRAERGAGLFSVVMLDLDHFKQVNDRHGHPAGDLVLRQFAGTLLADIRRHDVAGRYGGEEFALLMPDTDHAMAMLVAERIRADTEAHVTLAGEARIGVTVSGGVATFAADGRTWDELVAAADRALYRAKAAGRNRVISAGEESSSGTGAGSTPGSA